MKTAQITETRFNEIRQTQGACSTNVREEGNWIITEFYGKDIASIWRHRNSYTGEIKFFEEQDEAAK